MGEKIILFDVSYCDDIENNLVVVTPLSYFDEYVCVADYVDEDVFSVLDELGFEEIMESTFEYCGSPNSIKEIERVLLECDEITFEKSEEFSDFLRGE